MSDPLYNEQFESKSILNFPVIGIGASAGGLEALQSFFEAMPDNSGGAFVIVQHLSPDYKSLMDELLARHTSMVIHRVEDGITIEENHIYLIPPSKNMTIYHGKLLLQEQRHGKGLNLPIDIFLRSLAKDQEKNAIGIILSGTGSDGTLGIRAIKESGGMAMVQDDQSAKFDGMPRSSISTGMVDFILPPHKLADELVNYIKHPFIRKREKIEQIIGNNESHLSKVIAIIRDSIGVDFSEYKENTIIRRLEKRISINRFGKIEEYISFLSDNAMEVQTLFNELLIGVTRFFRDEDAFEQLSQKVFPTILRDNPSSEIRIWIPGCSTGEEPYSIAILISEYLSRNDLSKDIKIFATDLDQSSLEYAGAGFYPESIATDMNPEHLSRYFIKTDNGFQVSETIRSMIIFAKHNVLNDPPFTKIDLISCRNLLIYMNGVAQQNVMSLFYLALKDNGMLFLGTSESVGTLSDGFSTIDSKSKIYRKKLGFSPPRVINYGTPNLNRSRFELRSVNTYAKPSRPKLTAISGVFDQILSSYIPPSVIIDSHYEIVHTIHTVNKYLTLPVGQVNLNLLKMLPKEISVLVSSLLRRVEKRETEIVLNNISFSGQSDKEFTISAKKIIDNDSKETFFIVSFRETDKKDTVKEIRSVESLDINSEYLHRIQGLELELQLKSESLQATVEELETSNEELQSSNEELIASNEELQSTNEELQSVNEELYTVNAEHIKKIEELTELNADMDNLLKNTSIGTLYLDRKLRVRKTNSVATILTNIRASDIGRPVTHFSLDNMDDFFIEDITNVLEDLVPREREIADLQGNWYLMRIIPYRTAENAVDGIIILFINITNLISSQELISDLTEKLNKAMEFGDISWWSWNCKGDHVITGPGKSTMLGYSHGEIGSSYKDWVALLHPDDLATTMEAMKAHLEGRAEEYFVDYRIKTKQGSYKWYRDKGKISERDEQGNPVALTGVVMDVTEQMKREMSLDKFNLLYQTMVQGVVYHDSEGKIIDANPAAERILGLSVDQMKGLTSIDPQWRAVHEDGSDFPGETHPAMIALTEGRAVKDVVMGVFNPRLQDYTWININAVPLYHNNAKKPYQVYATFEDVTHKKGAG